MGTLIYGNGREFEFDDRTLSHVKIALVTKLRRHESFLLNWEIPIEQGGGRMSLWISREIPLAFIFADAVPPKLNERWMEVLMQSSQRTGGMVIVSEEEAEAQLSARHQG